MFFFLHSLWIDPIYGIIYGTHNLCTCFRVDRINPMSCGFFRGQTNDQVRQYEKSRSSLCTLSNHITSLAPQRRDRERRLGTSQPFYRE